MTTSVRQAIYKNKEVSIMTHEEQKEAIKPVLDVLKYLPKGVVIPTYWEAPEGYELENLTVHDVTVEHLKPLNGNGRAILNLHGGGYVVGLIDIHRDTAVKYSQIAGDAEVFSVEYHLAPEHKAPTAMEDAVFTYYYLLEQGYKAEDIIIIGDSAGGNLALATTLYLKDRKRDLPKAVIALSPWADADITAVSREENKYNDVFIGIEGCSLYYDVMDSSYFAGADLKNPYISPIYGDYKGFPNLLVQVGSFEILRDDSLAVVKAAKEAGVNVWHTMYDGVSHDFQITMPMLEETEKAWEEMKAFVESVFSQEVINYDTERTD